MFNENYSSVTPTNCASSGAIPGIGVPPNPEPGVNKKKKLKVILANAKMITRRS